MVVKYSDTLYPDLFRENDVNKYCEVNITPCAWIELVRFPAYWYNDPIFRPHKIMLSLPGSWCSHPQSRRVSIHYKSHNHPQEDRGGRGEAEGLMRKRSILNWSGAPIPLDAFFSSWNTNCKVQNQKWLAYLALNEFIKLAFVSLAVLQVPLQLANWD